MSSDTLPAFRDPALLKTALTHASMQSAPNNERLEFLGDRVLGLAVAEMLYRAFPQEKEGEIAKRHAALVQRNALAAVAEKLHLGTRIRVAGGDLRSAGTEKETILSDALEAVVGALYLDQGWTSAQEFVAALWQPLLGEDLAPPEDPKTLLQEWAQARALPLPKYKVLAQSGAAHAPVFEVEVFVETQGVASASAGSKREAEKEAARKMLEKINT